MIFAAAMSHSKLVRMNLVLVGASGHAKLVAEAVETDGRNRIAGLVDSFKGPGPTDLGHDILGSIADLPRIMRRYDVGGGLVAIGDNWTRSRIAAEILSVAPGFTFVNAVHAGAQVSRRAIIGIGNVFMAGAAVNAGCTIHNGCFVSTHASLDHDSVMESYSSLGPGATTGGNVKVGPYTAIALGAKIVHGISIGEQAIVGAGALVLDDIPGYVVAYGIPARVIRTRVAGDRYL
jgi:sugar O-acyltransferase (sialic acid O-acetyltransferase NeuD family)